MMTRVRVYMGCSFDGFIAGPDHDIAWLMRDYSAEGDLPPSEAGLRFHPFMDQIGAILMGRSTYAVVEGSDEYHYGDVPLLVATHRPLTPVAPQVQAVAGPIEELVERAKGLAGDKDVYIDGGDLVRQALDAKLVDEMTITFLPIVLGAGIRLFDGLAGPTLLQFTGVHPFDSGMVQVTCRVRP